MVKRHKRIDNPKGQRGGDNHKNEPKTTFFGKSIAHKILSSNGANLTQGMKHFQKGTRNTALVLLLFGLAGIWLWQAEPVAYHWQWHRLWRFIGRYGAEGFTPGPLLDGLCVTLGIISVSAICTACISLAVVLLRLLPWPVGRFSMIALIGLVRNTPLLIQMLIVYFLFAPVLHLNPFGAAVLTLSVFEGVYAAEILRAGTLAVPRQQWESAMSLGFSPLASFRLIVLPQAVRAMFPALTGQLVSLIKDSSLVSAIAVTDLTMRSQVIIADTFLTFETWLFVAAFYLVLTGVATALAVLIGRWLGVTCNEPEKIMS